jgi:16S rRNA (uracil1498-N3)-methyltransferase
MNLLLLDSEQSESGAIFKINGRRMLHLLNIKKVKANDKLLAGRVGKDLGIFHILEINSDCIKGEYSIESNPSISLEIEIFLSYQRPQTMKKILFLAGAIGISKIYMFPLVKTEKSYIQSSLWRDEKWLEELYLGMEQGKNIFLPKVFHYEKLHSITSYFDKENFYYLDPQGIWMNEGIQFPITNQIIQFILGPEGGMTDKDMDFFKKNGAKPIKLSKNILRTEHALTFMLAQLEILQEIKNEF